MSRSQEGEVRRRGEARRGAARIEWNGQGIQMGREDKRGDKRKTRQEKGRGGHGRLVLMSFGPLLELSNSVVLLLRGKRADGG